MRWTKVTVDDTTKIPPARYAHSATAFNKLLLVHGGTCRKNDDDRKTSVIDPSLFIFNTGSESFSDVVSNFL